MGCGKPPADAGVGRSRAISERQVTKRCLRQVLIGRFRHIPQRVDFILCVARLADLERWLTKSGRPRYRSPAAVVADFLTWDTGVGLAYVEVMAHRSTGHPIPPRLTDFLRSQIEDGLPADALREAARSLLAHKSRVTLRWLLAMRFGDVPEHVDQQLDIASNEDLFIFMRRAGTKWIESPKEVIARFSSEDAIRRGGFHDGLMSSIDQCLRVLKQDIRAS